jgi:uncharacterized protein
MGEVVTHVFRGYLFTWDSDKALTNYHKHGVSFKEACEVFFFPHYQMWDASRHFEQRWAFVGYTRRGRLLYVVTAEEGEEAWRIVSARQATSKERSRYEEADDSA